MKNIKGKVIVILIVLLILLIGILCIEKEVFTSSRTLFYKYLISGNIENITEIGYDEFLEDIKQKNAYKNSGNIKFSIEDSNLEDDTLKQITDKLNIKYNYQTGEDNKDEYINVKANYDNNEIINIEVLKNNLLIGIKEEDFIDKYMTFDLGSSKETLEKLNLDNSKVLNISAGYNPYNLFYISKKDRETIYKTYKNVVLKTIPKGNYKKDKKQEIEVNGNKYKCNVYKLETTEKQINDLYINILEELKKDDLTLNLLLEKYRMLNYGDNNINIEKMRTNIQKEIDEISSYEISDKNVSIIVYENNSKTVKTEIIKDSDTLCIDTTKNKKGLTVLIKSQIQGEKSEILFNNEKISDIEKTYKIICKQGTTTIKVDFNNYYEKNPNTSIQKLGEENSYNLTNMTNEEIEQFYLKLNDNASTFLVRKIEKLGMPLELFMEGLEEGLQNPIDNKNENSINEDITGESDIDTNIDINLDSGINTNNTEDSTSEWQNFINSQINI